MYSQSKSGLGRLVAMLPAMIIFACAFATFAAAQDRPVPKWELYGGYSVFDPAADVHGQRPAALLPLSSRLETNPKGVGLSGTYNFNRWLGLTIDGSNHWGSGETTFATRIDDTRFDNISLGPKFTFRSRHLSPFVEALAGDHRLVPEAFHSVDKLGFMAGGGLDINLSRHVAWRLLRADYIFSTYRFAPGAVPTTDIRGIRLQTGLNFMFGGGEAAVAPSAACSVQPTEVFAGEPVTATAAGSNFNPKRTVKYTWSGTGLRVAGTNASTQIDTTGLQPGPYAVNANLSDGGNGLASCSATFTVKQPRPPSISCMADPASVQSGGSSTIKSNASSPDGRRLTYSYTATAGQISGTGETATLTTGGAQSGPITVTCNVSDDRNPPLTASSTTTVNVEAPPPPPAPPAEVQQLETRLALHSIYFQTARPTVQNPTGGLLASQAEILQTLAADFNNYLKYRPDAHLILSGHADPRGSAEYNKALTERRVERTKNALVEHGVPQDHIETRSIGKEEQLTADQTRALIAQDPDLTAADRQQMLNNLPVMVLANNRRVDVNLSTTGQQSTRLYPFNAKDFLALINTKGVEKRPTPAPRKRSKKR